MEQMTIENFGSEAARNSNIVPDISSCCEEHKELEFTGNWFIDAGILGFVNLMEEVYGWDLEKLQDKIREGPEKVYYGYFPMAYLFDLSVVLKMKKDNSELRYKDGPANRKSNKGRKTIPKIRKSIQEKNEDLLAKENEKLSKKDKKSSAKVDKSIEKIKNDIAKLMKEMEEAENTISQREKKVEEKRQNMVSTLSTELESTPSEFKKIFSTLESKAENLLPDFRLETDPNMRNFYLFQVKNTSAKNAYKYLCGILSQEGAMIESVKGKSPTYEFYPDMTVNALLISMQKSGNRPSFSNYGYTDKTFSIRDIENIMLNRLPLFISLLCFYRSFVYVDINTLFYSPSLNLSYEVNKRLRIYLENRGNKDAILKITWRSIVDAVIGLKDMWALEEMYIIEYSGITNLKIKDVEFMGISKPLAHILMDDTIRDKLNKSIKINTLEKKKEDNKDPSYSWILERLLKGDSVYALCLGNIDIAIKGVDKLNSSSVIYSLATEFALRKYQTNYGAIFSNSFMNGADLKELPKEIKKIAGNMYMISNEMRRAFVEEISKNDNLILDLFIPVKKRNRKEFVDRLLKNLVGKEKDSISKITSYIFKNILQNDNWEYYALPIVMGLLGGNKND